MKEKIEHEGVISIVERDAVFVNILQVSACSGCHAKAMCNVAEMKEKTIRIPIENNTFNIGDKVIVSGASRIGLVAVWYAFVIPMILVLVLLFSFRFLYFPESFSVLLSLAGIGLYYLILYLFRNKFNRKFTFNIIKS